MKLFKDYLNEFNDSSIKKAEECYKKAKQNGYSKELEDCVIKNDKRGFQIYNFARFVKGANIQRLKKAIIELDKDGKYCFMFAANVKGLKKEDIAELQEIIIDRDRDGLWIHEFAGLVKYANPEYLLGVVRVRFGRNSRQYREIVKVIKAKNRKFIII